MASPLLLQSVQALNLSLGQMGSTFLSTTGSVAASGPYGVVHCLTAVQFAQLTDAYRDGDNLIASAFSFPAGTVLYGQFTAVQLASGSMAAIAYKFSRT